MRSLLSFVVLSCILLQIQRNDAFAVTTKLLSSSATLTRTNKSSSSSLFAVKKKPSKSNKKSNNNTDNNKISPMLAQWANTGATTAVEEEETKSIDNKEEERKEKAISKKATNKKKSKTLSIRREKQVQRKEEETKRLKIELTLINQLRLLLGDITPEEDEKTQKNKVSFNTNDILSIINQLVENNERNSNLRNIAATSNKNTNQYRMIWAGSDDAICHVGSGLHNVPLARLQEVFLSFYQSTIEVYEVIRIIGPFPNVKNTLKGDVNYNNKVARNNPSITYTSMIDGTGKEILAGKEENKKTVLLDVILATENIIVWKNPTNAARTGNNNGEDMLIFIKEFDMDGKLDILRVL